LGVWVKRCEGEQILHRTGRERIWNMRKIHSGTILIFP
jgi:hypothetical protein